MRTPTFGLSNICDDVEVLSNVCVPDLLKEKIQSSLFRENMDDSLFLCDLGEVMLKNKLWKEVFPNISSRYAVRCNSDENLLKLLIALGVGFNCSHKSEIKRVLNLGADADKIVYGNPCKQQSHIRFAAKNNVKLVAFDSVAELHKMKKNHPEADLILNISLNDEEASDGMNMKYGASMKDAHDLLSTAHQLALNVVGISFSAGNDFKDEATYFQGLTRARTLFDFASSIGFKLSLLDIGGDFPSQEQAFTQMGQTINKHLDNLFPSSELTTVIAEPARFFVESAFTICTNVIAKKEVDSFVDEDNEESDSNGNGFMYYINDGAYGAFNMMFTDFTTLVPMPLKKLGVTDATSSFPSSIWGPSCDGLDKITAMVRLPELQVGDWIMWKNVGAYSIACATNFNGFNSRSLHYFISKDKMVDLNNTDDSIDNSNLLKRKKTISKMRFDFSENIMKHLGSSVETDLLTTASSNPDESAAFEKENIASPEIF